MSDLKRYAPIQKMEAQDDGSIKVWGVASSEVEDNDGETIKAAAMAEALPEYMKWGAIREMHQPIAAGTCLEAQVDDATGQTHICAHIVDDSSIKKVKAGVLKGFSIGGVATATDPLNKKVITGLTLNEISLVDKPCNPDAAITLWKADMSKPTAAPVTGEDVGNEIETLVKSGDLSLAEVMQAVRKAAAAKNCSHGIALGAACSECDGGVAVAKAADGDDDDMAKAAKNTLNKRYFSEDERHDLAISGKAMHDGSFPIENEEDLKNAVKAHGRAKDPEAAKKHIISRAKEMGKEDLLPDDWKEKVDGNESGTGETAKAAGAVAPTGGSNEPAGGEGTQKAATTTQQEGAVEKAAGNADVKPVGPGVSGGPNAENAQPPAGVNGATANAQAATPMLPKAEIGDLVVIKWGEEEVAGEIKELGDGTSVTIQNGDAHLAVDSSLLIHHELVGTKRTWTIKADENANFTAAKPAEGAKGASKADISATLLKVCGEPKRVIQKGMYTVGDWSDMLQRIVWLYKDIMWEADCEADEKDKAIAAKLASWLKDGAVIWLEYAKDELAEMLTGVADPDNVEEFIIELASQPGALQKFADGSTGVGHVLKKAFGAGSTPEVAGEAIEKMINKAVATQVTAATERLEKAHKAETDGLRAEIEALRAEPAPTKGFLKGSAIVDKDGNLGQGQEENQIKPVAKADGTVDDAATAIKKAFAAPQQFNRLSTQ